MLTNKVTVTVPSTNAVSKKITATEHKERLAEVLEVLGRMYGGATATPGTGSWYSNELGQVIKEAVYVVSSYCTEDDISKHQSELEKCISFWGKEWGQEAMALEINGSLKFL